ncbi:MAG: helix-turn-helix domain-containing protein [Opitutaceae bacterium]
MPGGRPTTKPAPKFGQRMAAFRVAKGLSQAQLAEKLGMTRALVGYYEREAHNPSLELVERIAAFFGVSVAELLNDTARAARKPGPPSQFTQLAERLDQLPRAKQKMVADMLEGILKQAG